MSIDFNIKLGESEETINRSTYAIVVWLMYSISEVQHGVTCRSVWQTVTLRKKPCTEQHDPRVSAIRARLCGDRRTTQLEPTKRPSSWRASLSLKE
jgi:hypothetical protein